MKVHLHEEQFDGAWHPRCGRGKTAVPSDQFEATLPEHRCKVCERDWFPHGQPDWHLQDAIRRFSRKTSRRVVAFMAAVLLTACGGGGLLGDRDCSDEMSDYQKKLGPPEEVVRYDEDNYHSHTWWYWTRGTSRTFTWSNRADCSTSDFSFAPIRP